MKNCQKTDYDSDIGEIEKKITNHEHSQRYITTRKFNKLTSENFAARLKQPDLATKADVADFVKKTHFNNKIKNLNKKH